MPDPSAFTITIPLDEILDEYAAELGVQRADLTPEQRTQAALNWWLDPARTWNREAAEGPDQGTALCGRCGTPVAEDEAETCWWCVGPLCIECWDEYGHCGHAEAVELQRKAHHG